MGKDFSNVAKEIFKFVGSKENIISVEECVTRLRLKLKDKKRVDIGVFKSLDGILGVVETQDQLQLIIEPKKAKELIKEFIVIYESN